MHRGEGTAGKGVEGRQTRCGLLCVAGELAWVLIHAVVYVVWAFACLVFACTPRVADMVSVPLVRLTLGLSELSLLGLNHLVAVVTWMCPPPDADWTLMHAVDPGAGIDSTCLLVVLAAGAITQVVRMGIGVGLIPSTHLLFVGHSAVELIRGQLGTVFSGTMPTWVSKAVEVAALSSCASQSHSGAGEMLSTWRIAWGATWGVALFVYLTYAPRCGSQGRTVTTTLVCAGEILLSCLDIMAGILGTDVIPVSSCKWAFGAWAVWVVCLFYCDGCGGGQRHGVRIPVAPRSGGCRVLQPGGV